jgi:hypothetical protein
MYMYPQTSSSGWFNFCIFLTSDSTLNPLKFRWCVNPLGSEGVHRYFLSFARWWAGIKVARNTFDPWRYMYSRFEKGDLCHLGYHALVLRCTGKLYQRRDVEYDIND